MRLDPDAALPELVEHVRALVRLDTSNPGATEWPVVDYLRAALERDGIAADVVVRESDGRPNLVARLPGTGRRRPLLLLCHTDVVPTAEDGWTSPPFSGELRDGFVWGRGAVDMKHIVATMLLLVLLVRRTGLRLERDLIFAATADEETAGESGAGWLFRNRPDLVDAEFAISEGCDSIVVDGEPHLLVEIGEKGWVEIDLVRRSPPAHSSLPVASNCLIEVGRLLERLGARRFPHRVTASAARFIEGLAAAAPVDTRADVLRLLEAEHFEATLARLALPEELEARIVGVLHSHATPTGVRYEGSDWSVPSVARLHLAGRVLPGSTLEDWLAELEVVVGPLGEYELGPFAPGVESGVDATTLALVRDVLARHYEGARSLPMLMLGGGDLRHPMTAGATAFSFFPLAPEPGVPSIWELAHCEDERVSVANLRRCLAAGWDLLLGLDRS